MRTWFLLACVLSSTCAADGNETMQVRLHPELGLALVPTNQVILKMNNEDVPMTVNFKVKGQAKMKTDACFTDDEGHLNVLLSMTIMDQLKQELQPYNLIASVRSLVPNATRDDLIAKVDRIKMDASTWSQAIEKAVLAKNQESVRDEAWKPERMSTSAITPSSTTKPSTVVTTSSIKTTPLVTQSNWDGPFYPDQPTFRNDYDGAEEDYDELQYGTEFQGGCCGMECECTTVPTEEDFSIKIYKVVQSIEIVVNGLGSDVGIEIVEDDSDHVVVLDAVNGSLVFRVQDIKVKNAFATADTLVVEVNMFVRYLHANVMVLQCAECDFEAEVRILKKLRKWKRSVASWLFGLESQEDFERKMSTFKQEQEAWMNKLDVKEDTDRVTIENLRIHEETMSSNLIHLHDEICRMKEVEMSKIRELVVGNHSRRLVQRVMAVVSSCSYGHMVPKEIMTKDKWMKLCQATYISCTDDFLSGFINEVSCSINGVILTADDLVLDVHLRIPVGPQVKYLAMQVVTIPMFSNGTIRVFKSEPESVLIQTETGHSTVIDNCKKHNKWTTCDIEDSSEYKTACVGDAIAKREVLDGCFEVVPRRGDEPQCRISQTPMGLLVSTEVELKTSSTLLTLNGFTSDRNSKVIRPGISFIAHQVDDITKIVCQNMAFQTQYVGKEIKVVQKDLTEDESVFAEDGSDLTGWKDLSMDGILTHLSKSMDRMYEDPTVRPVFTKKRSHAILGASMAMVITVVVIIVVCCCSKRINESVKCVKQVCCCECFNNRRREHLQFNENYRLNTLERRSNQM